jgi:predicted transcriptional regulator of viral defense system
MPNKHLTSRVTEYVFQQENSIVTIDSVSEALSMDRYAVTKILLWLAQSVDGIVRIGRGTYRVSRRDPVDASGVPVGEILSVVGHDRNGLPVARAKDGTVYKLIEV